MIMNVDGENAVGGNGYTAVLGGCGSGGDTYMLSAHFLLPYSFTETVKPMWWQLWKKTIVTIVETEKWQRKCCILYAWQVKSIIGEMCELDVKDNEKLQTLLFVMGGSNVFDVQLESLTTSANYIGTSNDFNSERWKSNSVIPK